MSAEIHDFHRRTERPPPGPHNIEAEQALLGAILINNDAFSRVSAFLKPEHFSEELHRRIYDVSSQLIRAGKVASPITLKTYLGDADLGGVTIPQYLARLAAGATAIINTEDYGRTVYELAARRDLVGIGERLARIAQDQPVATTCADVAAASLEELHVIAATTPANPTRHVSAVADELMEEVEGVLAGNVTPRIITSGYGDIDHAISGLEPGTLVIGAGRPGMGKTMLANSIGYRCARSGVGVLEFPLEIGAGQMVARHLADIAYRGAGRSPAFRDVGKRAKEMPEDQVEAVREAHHRLRELPIVIDGRSRVAVAQTGAKVAQVKRDMRARGVELGLVIIDHLDFVSASDRYRGIRVQEIGEIVLGLKDIARSQGVCVLLMSQLSREVEKRGPKERRPTLADLRNSGDLEQVADVVMFLYREEYYATRSAEYLAGDADAFEAALAARGKLEVILAKVPAQVPRPPSICGAIPPRPRFQVTKGGAHERPSCAVRRRRRRPFGPRRLPARRPAPLRLRIVGAVVWRRVQGGRRIVGSRWICARLTTTSPPMVRSLVVAIPRNLVVGSDLPRRRLYREAPIPNTKMTYG